MTNWQELAQKGRAADPAANVPLPSQRRSVTVTLPDRSTEPLHVADDETGMAVAVQMREVSNVAAETADGYYVYPHAHASGGTLLHRELDDGAEDFVSFETRPAKPEVTYDVALTGVHAIRLVEGTFELLDAGGAPRLRAAPPFIVGADGERTDATVAVENCTVDTDPAPPWGRDIPPPDSDSCTLRIRWNDEQVQYPAVLDPRWLSTGNMAAARQDFTATMMSTGKILAVGGRSSSTSTTGLATAEVFDPTTNAWAATASLTGTTPGRYLHTAVQLGSTSSSTTTGRVFVAGGTTGGASLNTAQLYSPSLGTWLTATNLNVARHGATATLLSNGNVLLAAGLSGATAQNTAAVYNPSSGGGTYTPTNLMPQAVKFHTATLLKVPGNTTLNNKVLVVGGNSGTASVTNVQLFDGTSSWSSLTALTGAREGQTATALANGNVLVAGGRSTSATPNTLNTTLLFNAGSGSGSWASAGTLHAARQLHTATLLPSAIVENGQVLVAGGSSGSAPLTSAEVWNGTNTWTTTTTLPSALQGQTATLLNNNLVLLAGGSNNGTSAAATSMFFDGSFALQCTSNSQCATGFCVNGVCCDTACNGGCGACNLAGRVGTCSAASSGTVCRAQNGACDLAETCNGSSLTCPNDGVAALGTVCRPTAGACDVAETCDGTSKACPADGFAPATTVCRPSTGVCDAAETCTGKSAACPTDSFAPSTTVCRPAEGACDTAETCTGNSSACPADSPAAAGTVCRPAVSLCDTPETCDGTSTACPADQFATFGTSCGASSDSQGDPACTGLSATCPETGLVMQTLGFESADDWSFPSTGTSTIVDLSTDHTEGSSSLELRLQGYEPLTSVALTSIGQVGPTALLDIKLPTEQANPSWFGDVQMYVSAPSLSIYNVYLGQVELTGVPLATWQTIGFEIPAATAATLASSTYSDLTFTIAFNVPTNETGLYLVDNLRFVPDVTPSLLGVATNSAGVLEAVFTYTTTAASLTIPHGPANGLTDPTGFLANPPELPPVTFTSPAGRPFVAPLTANFLTWTVGARSATATPQSNQLPVVVQPDGTRAAVLPDGTEISIDTLPPNDPVPVAEPQVGTTFLGELHPKFSVGASGNAIYTLPITVPRSPGGYQPSLALAYNSQGQNGVVGQGWNLEGLSAIHRCALTRAADGIAQAVQVLPTEVGDTDGLCMDGVRLFQRPLSACPGMPAGTVNGACFESERKDFSVIMRMRDASPNTTDLNDAVSFTVVTRTGETRFYGSRQSSRVMLPSTFNFGFTNPNPNPPLRPVIWPLDRSMDIFGNYYDIVYNNDQGNQTGVWNFQTTGLRVTAINYGGHFNDITPKQQVTFSYEQRVDVRQARIYDQSLPNVFRMTGITTAAGTYTLAYVKPEDDPMLPSRLSSITYCSAQSAACLPALEFDWQGGGYAWVPSSAYTLPSPINLSCVDGAKTHFLSGTQLMDVDGDGLVDLLWAIKGQTRLAYQNTGMGWNARPDWVLPTDIVGSDGEDIGTRFVDMDGDGLADVVTSSGGFKVWLNRTKDPVNPGWPQSTAYSTIPSSLGQFEPFGPVDLTKIFYGIGDLDGDGLPDLIQLGPDQLQILALFNTGSGWTPTPPSTFELSLPNALGSLFFNNVNSQYGLQDVNGDGLIDLVGTPGTDGQGLLAINRGQTVSQGAGNPSSPFVPQGFPGELNVLQHSSTEVAGDIDGDGLPDIVILDASKLPFQPFLNFATGAGYTQNGFPNFTASLTSYLSPFPGHWAMADLNADGLAEFVLSASSQTLVNRGSDWLDSANGSPGQHTTGSSAIPFVPQPSDPLGCYTGAAFVDIDGDGVTDLVQAGTPVVPNTIGLDLGPRTATTYINQFQPPVIKQFPNGQAQRTVVSYVSITSADGQATYFDDDQVAANTNYLAIPLRVVSFVTADNGTGSTSTTTYQYHSLRASTTGHGPQGFSRIDVTDASGITTETKYAQAFPYTGLPTSVRRLIFSAPPTVLTSTDTLYCDTLAVTDPSGCTPPTGLPRGQSIAPDTSIFVYPLTITDTASQLLSVASSAQADLENTIVTTTTTNFFDASGNPTQINIQTQSTDGETYQKNTVNTFVTLGDDYRKDTITKLASTTVTTQRTAPMDGNNAPTTHGTNFTYDPASISMSSPFDINSISIPVLSKRVVEPTAGWPIEFAEAYGYDKFGNLTTTVSCANDYDSCASNATGPADTGDPMHLPFRVKQTSFDPKDAPASLVGNLSLTAGLYPFKTTDALGHSTYSIYYELFGKPLQVTDANGISTCFDYDAYGTQIDKIDHCGSAAPLKTTMSHFFALGTGPAKVVTVTRPPTGAASWSYEDTLGRSVQQVNRGFDGGLVSTATSYDTLGRVSTQATPGPLGATPSLATTTYDGFGRVNQISRQLGEIDGTTNDTTDVSTITFLADPNNPLETAIQTSHPVAGTTEATLETRNAVGKTERVQDAIGGIVSFQYDADENLTRVTDPNGNQSTSIYDARGRKTQRADGDLGTWQYFYDGFGELIKQIDGNNVTTTMTYDALGRMTGKSDPSGTSQWVYDQAPGAGIGKLAAMVGPDDPRANGPCSIPLVNLTDGNRAGRSLTYNQFGDLLEETACADGDTFVTDYQYDGLDRQTAVLYPAVNGKRLNVGYHYTSLGFLQYLTDDSTDQGVIWQANATDALGQVTDEQTRNGVQTVVNRSPAMGWELSSTSTSHHQGEELIQSWTYTYDEAGNVHTRVRADAVSPGPTTETFGYDALNRLTSAETAIPSVNNYDVADSYQYDGLGNITLKSGIGYNYGGCGAGPHAVCSVTNGTTTQSFSYDTAGNMKSGDGRNVTYNASNKATEIDGDVPGQTGTEQYIYGANGDRVVAIGAPASGAESVRTVYVGLGNVGKSLYERTTTGGVFQHVHYIYAGGTHGGNAVAVRVIDDSGTPKSTQYYAYDHLGSVTAMSDDQGKVVSDAVGGADATVMGYDAWGSRRLADGIAQSSSLFNQQTGRREFTGQETIPGVGLVNLNGRLYDPGLGRFLSPDPVVQTLGDLQAYNRYSYGRNNPLRNTDPTGYAYLTGSNAGDTILTAVIAVVAAASCVSGVASAPGCFFFFAFMEADVQMAQNLANGVGTGTALATLVISTAVNFGADFGNGDIDLEAKDSLTIRIISGATADMMKQVGQDILMPSKLNRTDVLEAAAKGAAGAALGYAFDHLPDTSHDYSIVEAHALGDSAGNAAEDASLGPFSQDGFDKELNDLLKSVPAYAPPADPGDISLQPELQTPVDDDPHFTSSGSAAAALGQGTPAALRTGVVAGSGSIGLSTSGGTNGAFYSGLGGAALPMASFDVNPTIAPNIDGLASGFAAAGSSGAFYAPQVDGQIVAGTGGISDVRPVGLSSGPSTFAIPVR